MIFAGVYSTAVAVADDAGVVVSIQSVCIIFYPLTNLNLKDRSDAISVTTSSVSKG